MLRGLILRLTGLTATGRVLRPRPGLSPQAAGLTEIADFGPNPGGLRMFVHVPARLSKAAPLVVVLHGCGQTAAGYASGAGWRDVADRLGFVLLAPEQQNANNMGGCFNWFQSGDNIRASGEAASIRQMIAHAVAGHDLDARRIFVTGLSAGGAMTAVMLATYPEIFAGGAIIAGLPYGSAANVPEALNAMRHVRERSPEKWAEAVRGASAHAGPWPRLSIWHGDADTTVQAGNAEALIAQWTALHGLDLPPSQVEQGPAHVRRSWRGPDGKTALESYTLAGLGHGVPVHAGDGKTCCGQAGPFFIEAGLSSTLQIAAFWGLSSPPVAVKKIVPARPRLLPQPIVPDAAPPAQTPEPVSEVAGVKGVILKALQAAGLINKP